MGGGVLRTDVEHHVGGDDSVSGAHHALLGHGLILPCRRSAGRKVGCQTMSTDPFVADAGGWTPVNPRLATGRRLVTLGTTALSSPSWWWHSQCRGIPRSASSR